MVVERFGIILQLRKCEPRSCPPDSEYRRRRPRRLLAERLGQLTKVVTHRGQRDGVREILAVGGDDAFHVAPELRPRRVAHAEGEGDAHERGHVADETAVARLWPLRQVRQAVERALVVFRGAVDGAQNLLVAFDETRRVHPRDEVQRALGIVPQTFPQQPPLLLQATPELRVGQGRQEADHRQRDGALADEVDLPLEDVFGVVVEADDEAAHPLHPGAWNLVYRFEQVAPRVLPLLPFLQALLDGRLDAEEDAAEVRAPHHVEQRVVFGQVDARLRDEGERATVRFRPFDEFGEESFDVAFVADEVVVNDEDEAAPAYRAQRVQFREHLLVRLRARHAPVDFDDVAELAVERAAARILHAHRAVAREFGQPEIGDGRGAERRSLRGLINAPGATAL